ncbi:MAG: type IA DNA topoisomerase [Butyrivibrio sp.]|nr:type IA DNA topoisomerase [Butyrivibrio sp.]
MAKSLFIAEKPSVAQEFMKSLGKQAARRDGYAESEDAVFTWCVGHLVTMSYPAAYDAALRRWSMETLPFIPTEWRYEVIPAVRKQFDIVSGLLKRKDIDTIYVCTDSGREGEYIYRLVEQMSGVSGKKRRRVWIDSQTEEEIKRGVEQAKDLSEYDSLSDAAYLRAKEDYLMGINFSRVLTLKYGNAISSFFRSNERTVIAVGRVMTCVLGMVVKREREIRDFVKTPFYRVLASVSLEGDKGFEAEWKAVGGSAYFESPLLYKENGFKEECHAGELIDKMKANPPVNMQVQSVERKNENKQPPLLYNLAELQNDCSKFFKLNPDETLKHTQELYEKKLVTYPRTDARVLSSAVAKVIERNIAGLKNLGEYREFAGNILERGAHKSIAKSRYVNDKQITDHYAIIPTGQGFGALGGLSPVTKSVYYAIVRRFLCIFYPAAVYRKAGIVLKRETESFFANFKVLAEEGYLKVLDSWKKNQSDAEDKDGEAKCDASLLERLKSIKKGDLLDVKEFSIKEGETTPPKRYNSGSMILAMENAGQLIEDEELRAQIKGSGIGTSATRAEILKKLVDKKYIMLNNKTQIITPAQLGEMVYDVVNGSITRLLDPQLTASWEKGLTGVANGNISTEEYLGKLEAFIVRNTNLVKGLNNQYDLREFFDKSAAYYK